MDACRAVQDEIDKVISKFTELRFSAEHLDELLQELMEITQDLKRELRYSFTEESDSNTNKLLTGKHKRAVAKAIKRVKETLARLAKDHRDLHGTISRVGKAIDKNFDRDYMAANYRHENFESPENIKLINHAICQHYSMLGMDSVVDELTKDSGSEKWKFNEFVKELTNILQCIKERDLGPAIAWCILHRELLEAMDSSLEFKLHRVIFIELALEGSSNHLDAISYARLHFGQLANQHPKEIANLMGMLMYLPSNIEGSPYSSILQEDRWHDIYESFNNDACRVMGINKRSHLEIGFSAGSIAVPALLNIKQVIAQQHVILMWNGKEELPIEIDLGYENHFHSMFSCPILRQPSLPNNPPMRLKCGHVISNDALVKLTHGNRVKCPYCPVGQSPQDATEIFF